MKAVPVASMFALLLSTLVPAREEMAEAVADHDRHPGLGHPAEGAEEHQHGDPDDHHETPDSPCHHHDGHTCCHQGTTLALANMTLGFEAPAVGYPPVPSVNSHLLPSARELFHVPLA